MKEFNSCHSSGLERLPGSYTPFDGALDAAEVALGIGRSFEEVGRNFGGVAILAKQRQSVSGEFALRKSSHVKA